MDAFFDYIRTVPFPFVVVGFVVVVGLITHSIHDYHKTRLNNELKQSMLERGMSAQDIERVMNAGNDGKEPDLDKAQETEPDTPTSEQNAVT